MKHFKQEILSKKEKRFPLLFAIAIVILLFLVIFSNFIGAVNISFLETIKAIFNKSTETYNFIIRNIRMPRVIISIMAGATLAVSGCFIQATLRNPLASPGILGVSTGAAVGGLLFLLVFPNLYYLVYPGAIVGGFIAFMFVLLLAYRNGIEPIRMILAGVAINAIFGAIIGLISVFNAERIGSALSFLNGHVNGSWKEAIEISVLALPALIISLFLTRICNILLLDDNTAASLGINSGRLRLIAIFITVILVSISIFVAGIIGFIALVAPHFAKLLIGSDHKKVIPLAAVIGAILVVGADIGGTIIFRPFEVPVGILISFLGAPFFLWILRREI